jgi:hypothetical protein
VNVSGYCAHGWMLFENLVVIQDRYPLLSMPDRQLPQPPAAAAAAADKTEGASRTSSTVEAKDVKQQQQQQQDAELWNSQYRVGFNRPGLAAQFAAAAHARHLWGPPLQEQQQQQQQQEVANAPSSSSSGSAAATLPRVVTVLLYPEDYPPVVNHYELVNMLRNLTEPYGFKVREFSSGFRVLGF